MYNGINANNFKLVLASLHMHMHRSAHTLSLSLHARTTNKQKKKSPGSWVQPVVPFIEQSSVSFCCQKA